METKQSNPVRNNPREAGMALYEKPAIEVIEMETEGILCSSEVPNSLPGIGDGGSAW